MEMLGSLFGGGGGGTSSSATSTATSGGPFSAGAGSPWSVGSGSAAASDGMNPWPMVAMAAAGLLAVVAVFAILRK